ncbi:hypothetical protein [Yoonia sp.]|uniref:hypothetical protein n=1 Tax=Yoonia sp. TaxID=2212373 RepID=UPI00391C1818
MILSRIIARRRIAAGRQPGFIAAWGPVLADIAIIAALLAVLWQPILTAIYVAHLPLYGTILVLLFTIYLPFQIVVVISTIWAVKSRWIEEDSK